MSNLFCFVLFFHPFQVDADVKTEDCTYNSFQFWRVPLPQLDLSLLEEASSHSRTEDKSKCKNTFSEAMETWKWHESFLLWFQLTITSALRHSMCWTFCEKSTITIRINHPFPGCVDRFLELSHCVKNVANMFYLYKLVEYTNFKFVNAPLLSRGKCFVLIKLLLHLQQLVFTNYSCLSHIQGDVRFLNWCHSDEFATYAKL